MAHYQYSTIDLSTSTFRLVRLFCGDEWQQIACELFEALFNKEDGGMPYEALSYTWGGIGKQSHIIVNGKGMQVTNNLYQALLHLRHSDRERYLWIDAICIDQSNNKERGHQVNLMSTIYKNAERVLVWLGRGTDDTDALLSFMQQRHITATHGGDTLAAIQLSTRQTRALGVLLRRPWFSRIWILQEIGNARTAMIVCGWASAPAKMFAKVAQPVVQAHPQDCAGELSFDCQPVLDLMPGQSFRTTDKPPLSELLLKFRASQATEERDRIYALMSLSSDANNSEVLCPDYSKGIQEVIADVLAFFVRLPPGSLFHLDVDWSWSNLMAIAKIVVEQSGRDADTVILSCFLVQRYQQVLMSLAQGVPACDLSARRFRAELSLPVLSTFSLKVIIAATGPDSVWRDLGTVLGPGVILFNLRQADPGSECSQADLEHRKRKPTVEVVLHPVQISIEDIKWVPRCGLMTWAEEAIDRIREDDRNKPLDVLMIIEKEDGNLSSMLASLRWNYDLMKSLYDNPQSGAYKWSLSFDNCETLLKLHELARSKLEISPVDDA